MSSRLLQRVFFYGTLKTNEPNHFLIKGKNVTFVSAASTVHKYPLIVSTDCNIPFLLNKKGHGHNIRGEIYEIDEEAKKFFDEFESVHRNFYSVEEIEILPDCSKEPIVAQVYAMNDFREELLAEHDLISDYTSDSAVKPYIRREKKEQSKEDNRFEALMKQMKK